MKNKSNRRYTVIKKINNYQFFFNKRFQPQLSYPSPVEFYLI